MSCLLLQTTSSQSGQSREVTLLVHFEERGPLTDHERFMIASDLHAAFLDELFRATGWTREDLVFHGGTSLKMGHGSVRFSEDLDFMVAARTTVDELEGRVNKAFDRVSARMLSEIPGSTLNLKSIGKSEKDGEVYRFDVTWKHPKRINKILVKLEFFPTSHEAITRYGTTVGFLSALAGGRIKINTPIPIASLQSIWGDKIKAIASRPYLKWRDFYDLAYTSGRLRSEGELPTGEEAARLIETSASIYEFPAEKILSGLRTVIESGALTNYDEFTEDMARWFPPDIHESMATSFRGLLDVSAKEVRRAEVLVEEHLCASPTATP
jgi:hypothetical protein